MPEFQITTLQKKSYIVDSDLPFEELQQKIASLTKIPQQNQRIIFRSTIITSENYPTMKNMFHQEIHVLVLRAIN
jgi:hypothetical protein